MSDWRDNPNQRILLDNGAHTIRIGLPSYPSKSIIKIPNAKARDKSTKEVYLGEQMENYAEHRRLELIYPIQRGLLHDSDLELQLWKHSFTKLKHASGSGHPTSKTGGVVHYDDDCLCLGIQPFQPQEVLERYGQLIFEDMGFDALFMAMAPSLAANYVKHFYKAEISPLCQLVVDSGFSFTYIIPYFDGFPLNYAAKRIDVGGKMLTNLLKQIISYRDYNMLDESLLVSYIKEETCYVSLDFMAELKQFQNKKHEWSNKEFILPDYETVKKGYVQQINTEENKKKSSVQSLQLNHSMVSVPEILFHPSDIEIDEAGISETIGQVVSLCPQDMQNLLYENIILTGGNSFFPNYSRRIINDLISVGPEKAQKRVFDRFDPILASWEGMKMYATSEDFVDYVVTRDEYYEYGSVALNKFQF